MPYTVLVVILAVVAICGRIAWIFVAASFSIWVNLCGAVDVCV